MFVEAIEIDESSPSNEEWKTIMSEKLATASRFEIHCWNEEQKETEMALQYGRLKKTEWRYGKVIEGAVTKELAEFLTADAAHLVEEGGDLLFAAVNLLRLKGVGASAGRMTVSRNVFSSSANTLTESGEGTYVEVVTLDEDIQEPVTIIKADIEGSEQDALAGAVNHIVNERPRLLISVYHCNEDMWKIPEIIRGMRDDYKFYLRFKGSSFLYPTELTLFAL